MQGRCWRDKTEVSAGIVAGFSPMASRLFRAAPCAKDFVGRKAGPRPFVAPSLSLVCSVLDPFLAARKDVDDRFADSVDGYCQRHAGLLFGRRRLCDGLRCG